MRVRRLVLPVNPQRALATLRWSPCGEGGNVRSSRRPGECAGVRPPAGGERAGWGAPGPSPPRHLTTCRDAGHPGAPRGRETSGTGPQRAGEGPLECPTAPVPLRSPQPPSRRKPRARRPRSSPPQRLREPPLGTAPARARAMNCLLASGAVHPAVLRPCRAPVPAAMSMPAASRARVPRAQVRSGAVSKTEGGLLPAPSATLTCRIPLPTAPSDVLSRRSPL